MSAGARRERWTILLVGERGQLGFELRRALAPLGAVVSAGDADQARPFDVTDGTAIEALVQRTRPQVVVNASAYTAVDSAEDDAARARAVNADGPGQLASAAARHGALVIHYSTDYVFDGHTEGAYVETDPVAPINVYGRTKLAGEQAVVASGAPHLVLRTGWLFAARRRNFPAAILAAAAAGRALRVVDDQTGCPTSARLLAEMSAQILAQARGDGLDGLAARSGIYHAVAGGSCTWYELASEVLRLAPPAGAPAELTPVSTADYGVRAPRPRRTVLDCGELERNFGLRLPPWREHVRQVIEERFGDDRRHDAAGR